MSCVKSNFTSTNRISIAVNTDDNVNSLVLKIMYKKWGFALSKDESEDLSTWEESIGNFLDAVEKHLKGKGVSTDIINDVKSSLKTNLLSNSPSVEVSEDNEAEIPDAELDTSKQKAEIKLSTLLRNIFGDDKVLTNNFYKEFKSEIFRRTIIQIGDSVSSSRIIYDVDTLNRAIMLYLSKLHNILYEYLKKYNLLPEGRRVANLYNDEGDINPEYSKNLNAFQEFLNSLDNLQKRISTETYSGNKELLNAVHAFLSLEYFNELMFKSVGKYLYINIQQTQPIIEIEGQIQYKYSINKKNVNLASGWQNEIRDGIDEIGSFSQLIIELIPLINTDSTLDKISTITAFLKLKYAISRLGDSSKLPNRVRIRNAYKNLNKNTIGAWKEILEVLDDAKRDGNLKKELIKAGTTEGKEKTALTDNDFNIFLSVYDHFFNKLNGVYHIERLNEFSGGRSNYGITESLFATINSTTEANYLEMRLVDGNYKVRYKEKWNSRDRMFQLRKAINDSVHRKVDERFLNDFSILSTGAILFGDFLIEVSKRPALGIFSPVTDYSSLDIVKDNKILNLNEYFKEELEESYSEEGRKNILNNKNNKYTEFINFLSNIDSKLGTKFLSDSGLLQLRIYNLIWSSNYNGHSLNHLYITAARVAAAYQINNEFKKLKEKNSELTSFDILKYLKTSKTPYSGLKLLDVNDRSVVNKYEGGIFIGGVPIASDVLDVISDAEAIFQGDNTKSVTRNLENNNIPNVSVNFTDIILEFLNQESYGKETPTSKLLFSGEDGAYSIIDTIIDTDVETRNGKKSVDLFTTSELLYHSLVNKFIYGIQNTGMFISLPTVYSDKKKFLNFVVNWKSIKLYKDVFEKGEHKNVYKIPELVHIDTILETLGEYYKTLFHKIANDYRIIFNIDSNDDLQVFLIANKKMKEFSKEHGKQAKILFIKEANSKGVKVFEDLHYRNLSKTLISPNETLYYYATNLYTPLNLSNFLKELKIAYVNQLLDNYVIIGVDAMIRDALDKCGAKNTDWIEDNLLVLAKVNGKNIVSGDLIPEGANIELNPILNTYFYLHNVIDNNIKLGISGHELHHKIKPIGKVLKDTKIGALTYLDIEQSIEDGYNSLIGTESQEKIDSTLNNIKTIRETLDKAYYTLISLAQNAQFKRTVPIPGTIRPFSQNTLRGIASTYDCAVVEDLKALTHDFLGNHGFEDASSDVDAHDGSAWVDPFTSILENYSLEDSEGGEVKKPLWDIDEPEYGVRRLVKYASNTISNRIMLQSSKSSLIMYKLFKKMTNCRKFDDIDLIDDWFITGGYNSSSFSTNIINKENPLFYSHNGNYYQITNFGKDIINGLKVYFTVERDVDEYGGSLGGNTYKVYHYFDENSNHIKIKEGELPPINTHTINSLFELHAAMGGIESMSIRDGRLIESEASNRAVAHFMIYVSKPTEKYNELSGTTHYNKLADITQEYFELPLKTRLINCLINQSAIKNGASNINSVDSLTDDTELLYDTYSTLKYGIQQDSDHTADEGKVTEMSLVISALDANGLYHDEVLEIYRTLGQQTIKAALIEEEAINSNSDKLYEVIGKTLINNIQRDERGLTRAILYQIRKNFGLSSNHNLDKIKIPFSDPSIYGKIMQVMGSILNKKSIKRKYPGMGLVMVPAFGIYLVWEIDGKKYQYKDLLKRAIKYNNELEDKGIPDTGDPIIFNNTIVDLYLNVVSPNKVVYDQSGNNTLWEIDPTNIINVTYKDSLGVILTKEGIKLDSLPDYYDFKANQLEFLNNPNGLNLGATSIISIEKNNKSPRDLAPTRIHFTYEYNGQLYITNIYDTWIYKEMYLAMKAKKQAEKIKNQDLIEYYSRVIKSYLKQIPEFLALLEKGNFAFKTPMGEIIKTTVTQLSNLAAETIMSNVYKSKMGIKDGDDIPDIDSSEYFRTSIRSLDSTVYDYDFLLITKNNNGNIYISLNPLTEDNENYQSKYQPWKTTNITKVRVNKNTDSSKVINRVYYIDNNNIKQFEIGRDLDVSDEIYYDKDTSSYKFIATNEVVTGRKLFRETDENGQTKILEYVEFLLKNEIKPKRGHLFTKYNIDLAKLNRVLLKSINSKTKLETPEKFSNALTNVIESLYKSDSFLMITPARRFKKENYNKITTVLRHLSERNRNNDLGEYLRNILNNVFTHSSGTILGDGYINLDSGNTTKLNKEVENLGINRNNQYGNKLIIALRRDIKTNPIIALNFIRIRDLFEQSKISHYDDIHLNKVALKQFASFLKSLFFTSSRIPAQTLQSFMKMECVGFNGVDTNYCAVTHFLTFLLGSDYKLINCSH